jgi:hypothetical protein
MSDLTRLLKSATVEKVLIKDLDQGGPEGDFQLLSTA